MLPSPTKRRAQELNRSFDSAARQQLDRHLKPARLQHPTPARLQHPTPARRSSERWITAHPGPRMSDSNGLERAVLRCRAAPSGVSSIGVSSSPARPDAAARERKPEAARARGRGGALTAPAQDEMSGRQTAGFIENSTGAGILLGDVRQMRVKMRVLPLLLVILISQPLKITPFI